MIPGKNGAANLSVTRRLKMRDLIGRSANRGNLKNVHLISVLG